MIFPVILLLIAEPVFSAVTHHTTRLEAALESPCMLKKLYNEYKATHQHYRSPHEESLRLKLFKEHLPLILEHRNNPDITWEVGLNFMADMTEDEREFMRETNISISEDSNMSKREFITGVKRSLDDIPSEYLSWWTHNTMGPARKQEQDSSFAHAAVAIVDAHITRRTGNFRGLSVQEMYDCSKESVWKDKYGRHVKLPLINLQESRHAGYEKYDKETPKQGTRCLVHQQGQNAFFGLELTDIYKVKKTEDDLMWYIAQVSPVAIALNTKDTGLDIYKGELWYDLYAGIRELTQSADMWFVAVAYDVEKFVLRTSYGPQYGHDGHLYLDRAYSLSIYKPTWTAAYVQREEDA